MKFNFFVKTQIIIGLVQDCSMSSGNALEIL